VRIAPGISSPNYRDLRSADLPIDLAAMQMARVTWRTPNGTKVLSAHVVSDNFFDVQRRTRGNRRGNFVLRVLRVLR
jgi:hypothetical protein